MAAITWTNVTDHAPELTTVLGLVSANAQADIIALVNARVAAINHDGEDGPTTKMARIYLAAHMASSVPRAGGASGPVTKESEGGIAREYAVLMSRTSLSTTPYGRAFLGLGLTSRSRAGLVL